MNLKKIKYLIVILLIASCSSSGEKKVYYDFSEIQKIEVFSGFSEKSVVMKNGFEKEFILDLNKNEIIGPTKYGKNYTVLLFKNNGQIDSLKTNGQIFSNKITFKVEEDLIAKYSKKTFFDFDEVIHYRIEIDENKLLIREEDNLSSDEQLQNDLIILDKPEVISDTMFVKNLQEIGFSKTNILENKFEELNELFSLKNPKEHLSNSCIAVYRDILIFKKNNKVIGVAKICFDCDQSQIIGTKINTMNFGQDGDYEKLYKLLKSPKSN